MISQEADMALAERTPVALGAISSIKTTKNSNDERSLSLLYGYTSLIYPNSSGGNDFTRRQVSLLLRAEKITVFLFFRSV